MEQGNEPQTFLLTPLAVYPHTQTHIYVHMRMQTQGWEHKRALNTNLCYSYNKSLRIIISEKISGLNMNSMSCAGVGL